MDLCLAWVPTPPRSQKQNGGNKMALLAQRRETERFVRSLADDEGFCLDLCPWIGGTCNFEVREELGKDLADELSAGE